MCVAVTSIHLVIQTNGASLLGQLLTGKIGNPGEILLVFLSLRFLVCCTLVCFAEKF